MSDLAKVNILTMRLGPRGRWHHQSNTEGFKAILALCERDERFKFPEASLLRSPLLSSLDGQPITQGAALHETALRSILTDRARLDMLLETSFIMMKKQDPDFRYINIGEKIIVPQMVNGSPVAKADGAKINGKHDSLLDGQTSPGVTTPQSTTSFSNNGRANLDDYDLGVSPSFGVSASQTSQTLPDGTASRYDDLPESSVAIIGMACRYPEADSLEEFWSLIEAGRCVVRPIPEDRYDPSELVREPKGPFKGGYLREPSAFDHRFFGISGREAKSMDPQQRMCLQVAYEALESSGYCGLRSGEFNREVGCYIGVANDDYDCNVASNPTTAFSLTGTLRTYISGRISHHFGWSGPSMTLDTACSASAVAIHTACKASFKPSA